MGLSQRITHSDWFRNLSEDLRMTASVTFQSFQNIDGLWYPDAKSCHKKKAYERVLVLLSNHSTPWYRRCYVSKASLCAKTVYTVEFPPIPVPVAPDRKTFVARPHKAACVAHVPWCCFVFSLGSFIIASFRPASMGGRPFGQRPQSDKKVQLEGRPQ